MQQTRNFLSVDSGDLAFLVANVHQPNNLFGGKKLPFGEAAQQMVVYSRASGQLKRTGGGGGGGRGARAPFSDPPPPLVPCPLLTGLQDLLVKM